MSAIDKIPLFDGLKVAGSPLLRFSPQPETRVDFQSLLSAVGSLASSVLDVPSAGGLDSDYQLLLREQLEVQRQMFLMSLYSNLEKSRHETQMAAVRNIRVG